VKVAQKVGLMGVQLHGEYTPDDCRALSEQLESFIVRAFRVATEADVDAMAPFQNACKYFLLDARVEDQPGGTGQSFPWELAKRAAAFKVPLFIAGGLTPDNVADCVDQTRPFAVDVASGVEKSPKRKDYEKMKKFIDQAKNA
jgi:phosphoribosylanthranilate isomerase